MECPAIVSRAGRRTSAWPAATRSLARPTWEPWGRRRPCRP